MVVGVLAVVAMFAVLAVGMPKLFASGGGLIMASVIAHIVGTTAASLVHPPWKRNAGRLAIVVIAMVVVYLFVVSLWTGPYEAGPSAPPPGQ